VLGELAEMFFEVRRLEINAGTTAQDATTSSFHVLNVVEGDGVLVEPAYGMPIPWFTPKPWWYRPPSAPTGCGLSAPGR